MDEYLSKKLKIISFVLMVMVVYLHANNLNVNIGNDSYFIKRGYNSIIQNFVSNGLTRIAVPLFFIISGYLFFLKSDKVSFYEYGSKLLKRSRTILLPYILWSSFGLLFYFLLQTIPQSKPFFTNILIKDYSISQLFLTIIYNPIPYQLWFIRDLMVIFIITPIIFLGIKHVKWIIIPALFIFWVFNINLVFCSNEALFFFIIGSYIAINKIKIQRTTIINPTTILLIWFGLLSLKVYLEYANENFRVILIIHKISILIGVNACWLISDSILKKKKFVIGNDSVILLSFFLYASHEPILTIIKKLLYYILGTTELTSLIIFILSPVLTISICLFVGYCLKKTQPRFYFVLTGGR